VLLFLGKSGGSFPVTGRLKTVSKERFIMLSQTVKTHYLCGFQKIFIPTQRKIIANTWGKGVLKAKFSKGSIKRTYVTVCAY